MTTAHYGEAEYHEEIAKGNSWKWEVKTYDRESDSYPLKEGDKIRIDVIEDPDNNTHDALQVYINDKLQTNFSRRQFFILPKDGIEDLKNRDISTQENDEIILEGEIYPNCEGNIRIEENGLLNVWNVTCERGTLTIIRDGVDYQQGILSFQLIFIPLGLIALVLIEQTNRYNNS